MKDDSLHITKLHMEKLIKTCIIENSHKLLAAMNVPSYHSGKKAKDLRT